MRDKYLLLRNVLQCNKLNDCKFAFCMVQIEGGMQFMLKNIHRKTQYGVSIQSLEMEDLLSKL